jgi:hypothetical protein
MNFLKIWMRLGTSRIGDNSESYRPEAKMDEIAHKNPRAVFGAYPLSWEALQERRLVGMVGSD